MAKQFQTKVNNHFEFSLTESDLKEQDILQISEKEFHLILDHKSHSIEILKKDLSNKVYHLKINSNIYKVEISNDLDLLIKDLGLSLGSSKKENEIKAPMPGLLLEINVEVGQEVKEGEALLVLEAMKMENTITASFDATIKNIAVEKGQSVAKNELLIEFE